MRRWPRPSRASQRGEGVAGGKQCLPGLRVPRGTEYLAQVEPGRSRPGRHLGGLEGGEGLTERRFRLVPAFQGRQVIADLLSGDRVVQGDQLVGPVWDPRVADPLAAAVDVQGFRRPAGLTEQAAVGQRDVQELPQAA